MRKKGFYYQNKILKNADVSPADCIVIEYSCEFFFLDSNKNNPNSSLQNAFHNQSFFQLVTFFTKLEFFSVFRHFYNFTSLELYRLSFLKKQVKTFSKQQSSQIATSITKFLLKFKPKNPLHLIRKELTNQVQNIFEVYKLVI
jgi:hypothetical protein